jgi:hypothetical protein
MLGFTILSQGDDLVVRPASMLTPELRAALRTAKLDLLTLLKEESASRSTGTHSIDQPAGDPSAAEPQHSAAPPEHLVQRLAASLACPRPWMRIADPERAAGYFRARALHMLTRASDCATRLALVEREEGAAARWGTPITSNEKEHD